MLRMKFLLAVIVYLVMGLILGLGILLAFKGNFWLLVVGSLAYSVLFSKYGCLPAH
jgi:hypothetical protein